MKGYIYLFISILFEIMGVSMLKISDGFTNLVPSLILVFSFIVAFSLMILSLKTVPISKGYSIWAGSGTAGTALIGALFFNEMLSITNLVGLGIIIVGVVVMSLGQNTESSKETA